MKKNDVVIKVNPENRQVYFNDNFLGLNAENLQSNLVFEFDGDFVNGTPRVEVEKDENKYIVTDVSKVNDTYVMEIKSSLLNTINPIYMQLVITEAGEEEIPIFKSKQFYLIVGESINASTEIPDEYETLYDQIQEKIAEVNNLNVTGERVSDGVEITFTDKLGNETTEKVNDGLDGEDGYTPQKGVDYWTNEDKQEMEQDLVNDVLVDYSLKVDTGHSLDVNIDSSTYVMTLNLKNSAGTTISTQTIDLPLESVVVSGRYDSTNKQIILELQNGNTINIPVGDLVSGLQEEITTENKLASDLVDDTNQTNKFVTAEDKTNWNNKMDKANPKGTGKIQIGNNVTAYGDNSVAIGKSENLASDKTTDVHIESALEGYSDDLINDWSGEYDKFSLSAGEASFTSGANCLALGKNSSAIGNGTIAESSSAFASGTGSHASGKYSFAGGLDTLASGQGSIAIGQRVKATGSSAIALGYNNTSFVDYNATGPRSLTIGLNSKASGEDSVAIGRGLIVSDSSRTAVGKYNQDVSGGLFLVGNGGGENTRSNAFYVDVQGRAYIKANLAGNENEKALVDLKYLRQYAQQYLPNRKILTKTAHVDDAKEAGFYQVDFTYKLNGEYIYGEMISIPYISSESGKHYGSQIFFATGDYDNGYQNCFWYRTFNGTSWNTWVKVDPSKYAVKNANNNFSSAQTINGTLTVNGDIVQSGQSYETHAEQLFTKNDIIKTRDGAVGGLGNNEVTGLEAIKYDGTNNGRLVFDNTGTAKVGDVGDEVPLLARDESTNLIDGQVLVWDSTNLIAKGSSAYVQKTTTVAGVDLQDNITKSEMQTALGVSDMVTLSQADYDTLVSGGTVDSNTYYFIEEE